MKTLTLINGNNQKYNLGLPRLIMLGYCNETALGHIAENTGLSFIKNQWNGYEAQPENSDQIAKLFMTYNFKTRYFNNWQYENTIVLKSDHHVGFDVDLICFDCRKKNHVNLNGLKPGDRLSC